MSSVESIAGTTAGILICLIAISGYAQELPSAAKVLDPDIVLYDRPHPKISRDGKWVAYVSRGFVCICNIADPVPRRLMEVPKTWTHYLSLPEIAHAGGDVRILNRGLDRDQIRDRNAQVTDTVFGLSWTHDGSAVVFGVTSNDIARKTISNNIWHVSIDGNVTNLMHGEQRPEESLTRGLGNQDFYLTGDRRFLVSQGVQGYHRPLIWDVATNRPRATCFLYLAPSPTSRRWLGIEKDTRQLVIADENFEIVKRFDEFRPAKSYAFKLDWSPDERFIILRNQVGFDHFSNWEGFWMNLDTGEKRKLEGRFMSEQIAFTGRRGELYRCGQTGVKTNWYDSVVGAHLTIIPEGNGPAQNVWRIHVDPKEKMPGALTNRPGHPPLRPGPKCETFAIGLPRPAGERSGWIWHLMDRDGSKWRFPGEDNKEYFAPYEIVGFAEGGKTIIAHDSKRLFSLPVDAVKVDANKVQLAVE